MFIYYYVYENLFGACFVRREMRSTQVVDSTFTVHRRNYRQRVSAPDDS